MANQRAEEFYNKVAKEIHERTGLVGEDLMMVIRHHLREIRREIDEHKKASA